MDFIASLEIKVNISSTLLLGNDGMQNITDLPFSQMLYWIFYWFYNWLYNIDVHRFKLWP